MPTSGPHGRVLARAVVVAALVAAAPSDVRTQDRMSFAARESAQAVRVREAQRLELERASAHARMPSTMYASTPDRTPPHPFPLDSPTADPTERPQASAPAESPTVAPAARAYRIALLPAAERWAESGYQGIVRIVNHGDGAGEVRIDAVDDAGMRHGTLTLAIGAGESVQLTSEDLERGNAAIGLDGAAGDGEGDWRLELISGLELEVFAYIRSADGFLTAVHDRVARGAAGHRVAMFNPGRDVARASRLRLVNPGAQAAEVRIEAVDDSGASAPGTVLLELPAGAARTLSALELEAGAPGLAGALGTGQGRWRLLVTSPRPIEVMSLVSSPTGHLTNVSTSPAGDAFDGDAFVHDVPLLPAAASRLRDGVQGFVRVINRSGQAGTVRIEAFDDEGTASAPLTLDIGANEAVHLTADDLEQGNPGRGLSEGIGTGTGDWRLRLRSTLELAVLAYVQSDDGFLASVHDLVALSGTGHRAAMFNPGAGSGHVSRLRLVNPGDQPARVDIEAVDEHGEPVGAPVRLELPARGARSVTRNELDSGTAGTWRLSVNADQPIAAMSLLQSPAGHLANLSTSTPGDSPESLFRELVSGPVVQSKCILCHVEGGAARTTRLLFVRASVPNHQSHNLAVFRSFLDAIEDDTDYVLNKIQGVGHGGGAPVPAGTDEFANMERFLALLGEDVAPGPPPITPETLFDTVRMASTRKTLRRAALIFAGRIPTDDEYAAAERGPTALRSTIRGLMTGPEFHDFLIRGANDRLLTDRDSQIIDANSGQFVAFTNENHRRRGAARASGSEREMRDYYEWRDGAQHGFRRAPLELIAHVVENDRPYTEVLTADYIMANPWSAAAYGASTRFDDPADVHEFKPSKIEEYYRRGEGYVREFDRIADAERVFDPGPLSTRYPHAGILNTTSFLIRYPTTATNRNRARSRWTYYHFLGLDVEKSASRTTDPEALADTNNPTMHNPACTVCHTVLDPVAGAFQNYGDAGFYKDQWRGLDSLDRFYKKEDGGPSIAVRADSWRDRESLIWPLWLAAGTQMLRVVFTNPFYIESADVGGAVYLDRMTVRDERGGVLARHEFEDLGPPIRYFNSRPCGRLGRNPSRRNDHIKLWWGDAECAFFIDVEVPNDGVHDVEIVAWADQHEHYPEGGLPRLAVGVNAYREGEIWYQDMRAPGFADEPAPDPDTSVQWLAERIVADERFAEATVEFWWPVLMGSEVAEPPEDEGDAGFEGLLLAANSQGEEVTRLARGFRRGFRLGRAYNLKDLLVEMALSDWFRADALEATDPVRDVALRAAGARRLLTPEELTRKTAALTGVSWERRIPISHPERGQTSALTDDYRLLYGGIDSDGVTERARDLTSVMAGVAKRHAAVLSCPIVMRELFLLPDAERRLFAGIDRDLTPGVELEDLLEIEADDWSEKETLSVRGPLSAGSKTVRLAFQNDYWGGHGRDRNVRLDRLDLRSSGGEVVASQELEDLDPVTDCNHPVGDHFALHCDGSVDVPIEVPAAGTYTIEVVAWADQHGEELARLSIVVIAPDEEGVGDSALAVRNKISELHETLLGVQATPHSPDVEAAYRLFVEVAERVRASGESEFEWWRCDDALDDLQYYEGILDDSLEARENDDGWRWYWFDWDRVNEFLGSVDWSDPHSSARAWAAVLAYLLMDYRYLYL